MVTEETEKETEDEGVMEHTTIATHDRRRGAGPVEGVGLKSGGGSVVGARERQTQRRNEKRSESKAGEVER